MAKHVTLTVYGDDDQTPLFEVSTDPAHPNPYLHMPEEFGESDVDLLRGKAQIGQVNVRVIDPQTGATQAERFMTALLGNSAGYSALNRRRAVLREAGGDVIIDGVIGGVTLNETFAGFTLPIRDVRERGRKVPCLNWTTSCTVFPRGVKDGYGALPGGGWLKPPTRPVRGHAQVNPEGVQFIPEGRGNRDSDIVPAELALSQAQIDAFEYTARTTILGVPIHDRIRVRWRPVAGGAWNEVKDIVPRTRFDLFGGWNAVAPVAITQQRQATIRGQKTPVNALYELSINGVGTLPTHGQQIEIIVDYVGPVSEQWPFHWEGPWGDAVAHLLDGDWSYDEAGNPIDPRIAYDVAAVAAIQTPVRIRLTEAREDVRKALEEFCAAVRAAPALNTAGEIAPIQWHLPDTSEVLPQIDDTNAAPIAGWEHPADTAITAVEVTYQRIFHVPQAEDPNGERSAGDGLASREVIVRHRAPQPVLNVMGEQDVLKVDAWMLSALGGSMGQPVTADVRDEVGAQQAEQLAQAALDRSVYGQQSSFVRLMASDFPGLKPGDWVLDARSWAPNYVTGTRGGNSLAQVTSVQRRHAWLDCRLVHSGPADALLAQPTFAAPAVNGGVITVSALTAPADVEVQYALGTAEPTANSGDWTFLGRRTGAGDIESHEFASGVTVWLRGRSVGRGRRPSTWVSIGSAAVAAVPRLHSFTLQLLPDGSVRAEWEANPATKGLRLYYEAHAADATPGMASFVDVDASVGSYTFAAALANNERFSVDGEPYPAYPIAGTPGDVVSRVLDTSTEGTGIRWLGEFAEHPANPQVNDAYRNTADGVVYIWTGTSWEVMARDGLPGTGTGLEVRYSGPAAGQNISDTFNPALHVYMQMRRTDQAWPAEWARIIGEDGDPGADGVYYDYRFRVAATQPATPTGTNPSGWFDAPPAYDPGTGDKLWMTRALKNAADDSLLGTWSTPVQMTGPQGPAGQAGADGVTAVLSNDSHVIPTNPDGSGGNYAGAETTISVFQGATDVSASWNYSASPSAGVTGSLVGRTYTVTNMTVDRGYVDITATRNGFPSLTVRFTLAKSKQGAPATAYWLITDVAAIKRSAGGAYTPASITVQGRSATGTSAPVAYAGRFRIATSIDGVGFTTRYTSASDETSHIYALPAGIVAVRVRLYAAGGTTNLLDEEIVPVVDDGPPGDTFGHPPTAHIVALAATDLTMDLRYSGSLGTGATGPLQWRRRIDREGGPEGSWGPGAGDGWVTASGANALPYTEAGILRDPRWDRIVKLEVRDANGQLTPAQFTIMPADIRRGGIRGYDAIEEPVPGAGYNIAPTVEDSGGREIRSFYGKPLPGDPDNFGSIVDGGGYAKTTTNERAGAARGYAAINASNRLTTGWTSTTTDNAGRNANIFLAKGLVADPDHIGSIADGGGYRKPTVNEATGGGRAYSALDSSNELVTAVARGASVDGVPAYLAARQAQGVFIETFDKIPPGMNSTSSVSITQNGITGANVMRVSDAYRRWYGDTGGFVIPFDPSKLYRIRTRMRVFANDSSGTNMSFYAGVRALNRAGNTVGGSSGNYYITASGKRPYASDGWVEYTGWLRGHGAYVTNAHDPRNPSGLHEDAVAIAPLLLINYSTPSGQVTEVDYFAIDVFDEEAQRRLYGTIDDAALLAAGTSGRQAGGTIVKSIPKGVVGGTCFHKNPVVFDEPYQNAPRIIFLVPAAIENRAKWGTKGQVDGGTASGSMPLNAFIRPRPVAADVSSTGFTPELYIEAKSAPVQRSATFLSASGVQVGQSTGSATPNSAHVPAMDNTYRCRVRINLTNMHMSEAWSGSLTVALRVSLNGAAFSEVAAATPAFHIAPGDSDVLFVNLAGTVAGVDGVGGDAFQVQFKSITPAPQPSIPVAELSVVEHLNWTQDAGALYASMTPDGPVDAIPYLVIADG